MHDGFAVGLLVLLSSSSSQIDVVTSTVLVTKLFCPLLSSGHGVSSPSSPVLVLVVPDPPPPVLVVAVVVVNPGPSLPPPPVDVGPAPSHDVAGLAATQPHNDWTAGGTLRASPMPHAPMTQLMAEFWMMAEEAQRQL
jgi:hypothetical protein